MAIATHALTGSTLDAALGWMTDLAAKHPDVVARAVKLMEEAHEPNPNWKIKGKKKR